MPAMWNEPHWEICTRCGGTGKSAGGDCGNCRLDGFPVGQVLVHGDGS